MFFSIAEKIVNKKWRVHTKTGKAKCIWLFVLNANWILPEKKQELIKVSSLHQIISETTYYSSEF